MKRNKNLTIGLSINLLIVLFEIIGLIMTIQEHEWRFIQYYTQDSNMLAMFACGIMAICQILCLLKKQDKIPHWVTLVQYIAVCMLTVTFLVVIFILAPMYGGLKMYTGMLFQGAMLFFHFLCPIMAFVSFVFIEKENDIITKKEVKFALIPTVMYALVTTTLNILRIMTGPYPFLLVYKQPVYMTIIWICVILCGAYLIALMIKKLQNKFIGIKINNSEV